jgi:hypothetical protein
MEDDMDDQETSLSIARQRCYAFDLIVIRPESVEFGDVHNNIVAD